MRHFGSITLKRGKRFQIGREIKILNGGMTI